MATRMYHNTSNMSWKWSSLLIKHNDILFHHPLASLEAKLMGQRLNEMTMVNSCTKARFFGGEYHRQRSWDATNFTGSRLPRVVSVQEEAH